MIRYVSQNRMKRFAKEGLLEPLLYIDLPVCKHYLAEKAIREPFGEVTSAQPLFLLIDSDICRPINVKARPDAHYFITFIDDITHFGVVYLICHRYEVLDCFKCFHHMTKNQLNTEIKALRTDRSNEYILPILRVV